MTDETRELMLEGLRQALRGKVATIWTNVSLAGEENRQARFIDGVSGAAKFYAQAVKIVEAMELQS